MISSYWEFFRGTCFSSLLQQLSFKIRKIVIALMKIVEFVGAFYRRGSGGSLFTAFPVVGVQTFNIGKGFDAFLIPGAQNPVGILKTGLPCLRDGAGAGFQDNICGKTVIFAPVIDQTDFGVY